MCVCVYVGFLCMYDLCVCVCVSMVQVKVQ